MRVGGHGCACETPGLCMLPTVSGDAAHLDYDALKPCPCQSCHTPGPSSTRAPRPACTWDPPAPPTRPAGCLPASSSEVGLLIHLRASPDSVGPWRPIGVPAASRRLAPTQTATAPNWPRAAHFSHLDTDCPALRPEPALLLPALNHVEAHTPLYQST